MDALVAYDWPGNVRELENLIERAAIVSVGDKLYVDTAAMRSDQARGELSRPSRAAAAARAGGVSAASLENVEREHILFSVLKSCGWKVRGVGNAAEQLGLKESTLRSRMKRLGITRPCCRAQHYNGPASGLGR